MSEEEPKEKETSKARRSGQKIKRGKNKFLLRIFRGYDARGKRIYYGEMFRGPSKEADDRLDDLRNRHQSGEPLKFTPKLFKDFFIEWLEDCPTSPTSRSSGITKIFANADYRLRPSDKFTFT
jgi:hypothetical protein